MTMRALFFAVCAAALCAPQAQAAEFTILIYETDADLARRTDPAAAQAYWTGYNALAGEMAGAGVLRGGTALSETEALTVSAGRGGPRVRDGAGRVRGARAGGYLVVEAQDIGAAADWAKKAAALTGASVEVRPHRPNPLMPMMAPPAR